LARKQVELIGGGFYEPMMPLLSHQERMGQVELLTTYLRKSFNKRVTGAYVPDIAWKQSLAYSLSSVGMLYTFADEKRFMEAGLTLNDYDTPCVTEDRGRAIIVFPVFSSLGKALQEHNEREVFDALLLQCGGDTHIRTIFPDFFTPAEKLNISVDEYLQHFFETISTFAGKIELTLPSKILKNISSPHPVYFHDNAAKKYLIENPAAALVYAKMVWVRSLIEQLKGDKERKQSAQEELWKAQGYSLFCYDNDFEILSLSQKNSERVEGINNAVLRTAVYSFMLLAEQMIRGKGDWKPSLIECDFNFDGIYEYLFQSETMNCYTHLRGAALFELDFLPKTWNYLCTVKTAAFPEQSFFDCLVPLSFNIKDIISDCDTPENSALRICGNELFERLDMDRVQETASFRLHERGGAFGAVEIKKDCELDGNVFSVHYTLSNKGKEQLDFQFVTFFNFSFPDNETNLRIYAYDSWESFSDNAGKNAVTNEQARLYNIEAIDFQDLSNELIINISSNCRYNAIIEPVYTKYRNITGDIVDCYQSTRITAHHPVSLVPGGTNEFKFKLGIFY
jgi:hypothetical protein